MDDPQSTFLLPRDFRQPASSFLRRFCPSWKGDVSIDAQLVAREELYQQGKVNRGIRMAYLGARGVREEQAEDVPYEKLEERAMLETGTLLKERRDIPRELFLSLFPSSLILLDAGFEPVKKIYNSNDFKQGWSIAANALDFGYGGEVSLWKRGGSVVSLSTYSRKISISSGTEKDVDNFNEVCTRYNLIS